MPSPTTAARERARPLLGTIVRIAADGGSDYAIDEAFAEIEAIHDRMSYQSPTSDLAAIARAAPGAFVSIDRRTRECLRHALGWAERSGGAFDPVAAAAPSADWRDLRIVDDGVAISRRLRVDLSGIAKGYAVDAACAMLVAHGVERAVVEAGGDLRVVGDVEEVIALRPSHPAEPALIALADGALASTDPALTRTLTGIIRHLDARGRRPLPDHFITVTAPCCVDADALTKIVLALGDAAAGALGDVGAIAYRHDGTDWSTMGVAA